MTWTEHRACVDVDPAVFFPDDRAGRVRAKAICATCPVAAECLTLALENRELDGIWGGLTPRERRPYQRAARRPQTAACGTDAGYHRHRRRMESACWDCTNAHAEKQRDRKQARRARVGEPA